MARRNRRYNGPSKDEKIRRNIEAILRAFETGTISEAIEKSLLRRKAGDERPSDRWSRHNRVIMFVNDTEDARGYRQWQEVGRHVKRGAEAFYIWAPRTVKEVNEETGEETWKLVGFLAVPVFRVEDTEGEPVPSIEYEPIERPPMAEVAERLGVTVKYGPAHDGYVGSYDPATRTIDLHTHDPSTLWHELAHVAHEEVLRRRGKSIRDVSEYEREAVAEVAAAVIGREHGVDLTGTAWHYLTEVYRMRGTHAMRVIAHVIDDVAEVAALLLGLEEEANGNEDAAA